MNFYTGEISELIREHGFEGTARILEERKRAASVEQEPTQGDASDLSEDEWRRQVKANRRAKT